MVAQFLETFVLLTIIIWSRYFLIAGLFYFLLWGRPEEKVHARRLAKRRPQRNVMLHEIRMSLISSVIYALPGAIVLEAYKAGGTALYTDINGLIEWVYIPASIFIYLFIHDTYFYWTHRAMHHPRLFMATHFTHHRSRQPTTWAAFSFHPWEAAISAWLLPLATFFIPLHITAALGILVFMTFCSVVNHAGWEIYPRKLTDGVFGAHIISASHHNLHHSDYGANFGLYFRFWDRLMGTDKGLEESVTSRVPR